MSNNQVENNINKISNDVKIEIMTKHVEPAYKKDIIDLINGKRCWRISGQTFETISKVFVAVGSIISFAAGVYNETTLSFIAGSISTFSLATLQFASFSYRENKKQSNELNSLLKNIDLAILPMNDRTVDDTYHSMRRSSQGPESIPMNQYQEIMNEISKEFNNKDKEIEILKKEIENNKKSGDIIHLKFEDSEINEQK